MFHHSPNLQTDGQDSQHDKTSLDLYETGTKLPIHSVALEVNRSFERIESGNSPIVHVSENGDISIDLSEYFPTLMKG